MNEEVDALLNWKASLQNETQPPLPSWNLRNYATNSSNNQNTSSIPCSWLGISCNQAGSVIGLNMTNSGLEGIVHGFSILAWMNSLVQSLLKLVNCPNSHTLICHLISSGGNPTIDWTTNQSWGVRFSWKSVKRLNYSRNRLVKVSQCPFFVCQPSSWLHSCIFRQSEQPSLHFFQ